MEKKQASTTLSPEEYKKIASNGMGLSHSAKNLPLGVYVPMEINGSKFTGRVNILLDSEQNIMGHTEVSLVNFTRLLPVYNGAPDKMEESIASFRKQKIATDKKADYSGFTFTPQAPASKGMQEETLVKNRYTLVAKQDVTSLTTPFANNKPVISEASLKPSKLYDIAQIGKSKEFADKLVAYVTSHYSGEGIEKVIRETYE